jgi:cytochrome c biogenesis protein CcmG, thiol:disulfide interchange protein DsbE
VKKLLFKRLVVLGVSVLATLAAACTAAPVSPPGSQSGLPRIGAPAPDVDLPLLQGGTSALAGERGKVVLLNFWATWCEPCRAEMPELQHLADELQAERFTLLTVDVQDDRADIADFRKSLGLRLPTLLDEDGEVSHRYGVRALPATFLIDAEGDVRQQRLGPLVDDGRNSAWTPEWLASQVHGLAAGAD